MDIFGSGGFAGFMQPVIAVFAVFSSPMILVVLFRLARLLVVYYWRFVEVVTQIEFRNGTGFVPNSERSYRLARSQGVAKRLPKDYVSDLSDDYDVDARRDL